VFDTGVAEIDEIFDQFAQTADKFEILQENGESLLSEANALTPIVSENYTVNNDPGNADNDSFTNEMDNVLDFSERNPFGEAK
jgi:hypothetical protein